ncbi:MAG: HEAT repeat domain-containing protein [Desulfobacterales bacterium]|nr:HEAT repeat domain-containing protein [Desulfobacterales bacterium]
MKKLILIIIVLMLGINNLQLVYAEENVEQKLLKQYREILTRSKDVNEQREAFKNLSKFEPKTEEQVDFIIRSIGSEDRNISFAARNSLLNVKDTKLVPKMITALEDENVQVKVAAIGAIARLKDKRAIPSLVKCLDEDEYISTSASLALAEIGDESVIPDLLERIGKPNAPTGVALSQFGAPALKAIIERLDSQDRREKRSLEDREERFRMIQTIGFIKDPQAVPYLKAILKNKNSSIRVSAVQSLGNIGELNISDIIKDDDPIVRLYVVEASRKIQDPAINTILIDVFAYDKSEEVRILAANVLADKKCYEAIPYLEAALDERSKEIRLAAKMAIEKIKERQEYSDG